MQRFWKALETYRDASEVLEVGRDVAALALSVRTIRDQAGRAVKVYKTLRDVAKSTREKE